MYGVISQNFATVCLEWIMIVVWWQFILNSTLSIRVYWVSLTQNFVPRRAACGKQILPSCPSYLFLQFPLTLPSLCIPPPISEVRSAHPNAAKRSEEPCELCPAGPGRARLTNGLFLVHWELKITLPMIALLQKLRTVMSVWFRVCGPKFMSFWDDEGDPLLFATHLPAYVYRVSVRRYKPLKLPFKLRNRRKSGLGSSI